MLPHPAADERPLGVCGGAAYGVGWVDFKWYRQTLDGRTRKALTPVPNLRPDPLYDNQLVCHAGKLLALVNHMQLYVSSDQGESWQEIDRKGIGW